MNYHILKRITDQGGTYYTSVPSNVVFTNPESLKSEAIKYATEHPSERLLLVQEFGVVAVEPVVTLIPTAPAAAPSTVYRGEHEDVDTVKRTPTSRPRLCIIPDRRATGEEIFRHLMVVAEGRIVKNAFGALELDDMPLTPEEYQQVTAALGVACKS